MQTVFDEGITLPSDLPKRRGGLPGGAGRCPGGRRNEHALRIAAVASHSERLNVPFLESDSELLNIQKRNCGYFCSGDSGPGGATPIIAAQARAAIANHTVSQKPST